MADEGSHSLLLVAAAQTEVPFLPSENQNCGVDCTGPEWPPSHFLQADTSAGGEAPVHSTVTKIHMFESRGLPCPESSQLRMPLQGHAAVLCPPVWGPLALLGQRVA